MEHKTFQDSKKSGFTLIELLITIAILTTLAVIGGVNLFSYSSRQSLTSAADEIVAILRQAQTSSISQESGDQWGVHFLNATTTQGLIQLFHGSSFAAGTLVNSQVLPSGVQFINPVSGTSTDVIFSKVTGYPNASASIKLALIIDSNTSSTITISAIGKVSRF
ncbi:MAG: prepilin-type N-terminal cleavage/methylation domain-containing protein [bacterium]|nr:prepilin-type N-terminal cleavage/methylation domain-containing protein [bacterium]